MRISYAIILFYSILEELGLEIRASSKVPSKINGKWNSEVKADLEKRLISSGININNKINWNLRSTPTKIEKLSKPAIGKKSEWSKFSIRDSEISIPYAIAQASWIRGKVASHKVNEMYISLSIYDVANINFLVRNILLDILHPEKVV